MEFEAPDKPGTSCKPVTSEKAPRPVRKKKLILAMDKKPEEGTTPFYMISGAGGHVISLQLVARGVSEDWKSYGVLHPLFIGEELVTIQDNARLMAEHILKSQPEGPYYLVGYSLGGLFCIEIARLLLQRSLAVKVILLDTKPPQLAPLKSPIPRMFVYLRWSLKKVYRKLAAAIGKSANNLADVTYEKFYATPNLPKMFQKAWQLGSEAYKNYVPSYCPVPVVLIKGEEQYWRDELRKWTHDYCWSGYVDLQGVIQCPGGHLDLVKADQYWNTTASAIDDALEILSEV